MKKEYILVIDSGVGGLSILAKLYKLVPANFIYFADRKNCPYGKHKKHEIFNFLDNIIKEYTSKYNIKIVVLACNTATTTSIKNLRKKYKDLTFVGTEPAIKLASDAGFDKILVLSTPATAKQNSFKKLKQTAEHSGKVIKCLKLEFFAIDIEKYFTQKSVSSWFALLKDLFFIKRKAKNFDCVVLGCTHYPLISNLIQKYVNKPLLSGSLGVSRRVFDMQKNLNTKPFVARSSVTFFSSADFSLNQKYKKIFKQILANKQNIW